MLRVHHWLVRSLLRVGRERNKENKEKTFSF